MTMARHECRKIDLDFFDTAPVRLRSEVELPCTPEVLFRSFEDGAAWEAWVDVIEKVEWTSPLPFRPGTTRTVHMPGGMAAYEEFLAWDAPRHVAFRFNQFTHKFLKAFGENYEVTDLGNGRCRLVWTVGMEPGGLLALFAPLLKPLLARNTRKIAEELRRFMETYDG